MLAIIKLNSYYLLGVDYNAYTKDTPIVQYLTPITEASGLPVFVLCTDMKAKVQENKFLLSAEVRICP